MCTISDTIKFCSCSNGSHKTLQNYWLLYRFKQELHEQIVGLAILPDYLYSATYQANEHTLVDRLNEPDAFDKPLFFEENDQMEIVVNNLLPIEDRIIFSFVFHEGMWIASTPDPFEKLSNRKKLGFGSLENGHV